MTLRIALDGRTSSFDGSTPVRIGRGATCEVVLSAPTVSRLHAELRREAEGWVLVDAGGQLGTFVQGERVTERLITGTTTVQCGPEAPGSSFTVTVDQSQTTLPPAAPSGPPAASAPPPYGAASPVTVPPSASTPPAASYPPPPPSGAATAPLPVGAGGAVGPGPSEPGGYEPGFEPTYIMARPALADTGTFPGVPAQPRSGPELLVEAEGHEHRFRHPDQVTIGRLPQSRVVISDPVASRAHLRVDAVPDGWVLTNLSREGTFVDGRRVETMRFDDRVSLRLGHPTAGPAIALVPVLSAEEELARLAHRRRSRQLKIGGLALGALALVLVLIVGSLALFRGGGSPAPGADVLTQTELNQAKSQTVLIYYNYTPPGSSAGEYVQFHGSGSVLTSNGLILTNAHVVAPNAPGLSDQYAPESQTSPDPDYVTVRMTNPQDGYATDGAVYRAKVIEADGHLDGAVIQIYADSEGNAIDPSSLNLAHYTLGDSDAVQSGNAVTVLGFPGIAESQEDVAQSKPEVTVTQGVISTIIAGSGSTQPEIDTDARIAPGNSGGSAIDSTGQLIGVPSSVVADQGGVSGRIRPINIYKSLISDAESTAGTS